MARWHVQVVQMRARDVRRGDVVARDPNRQDGWFRVHEVLVLPDGQVNVLDKSNQRSFTAGPYDLIGLQTPIPLPAEADASNRRRRRGEADTNGGDVEATDAQAAAREAVARDIHTDQVRGTLPGS